MTREEAKEVFLNRGFIDGIYNGDKWREACIVISKWLEQEPKTGHWDIKDNMWWVCSACGCQTRMMKKYNVPNFCPACGAKMVEPQESEG